MGALGSLVLAFVISSGADKGDLTRLSIDELASLQVVPVSRKPEARIEAAGAIHVITEEDIRSSRITTLPDFLRLSPGVQASRFDADEWAPLAAATPPPQEYEVKAAFLYHFAHLVDWPAPSAPGEPFVIAVVGYDPFGATLDEVLAGKSVHGQPVRVRRFAGAAQLDGARVHILFVGRGGDEHVRRALSALTGQPVLTVGESQRFAERGGMIGFRVTAEGRVAFDINLQRAEQSGLWMSSQLLKLARIVGPAR